MRCFHPVKGWRIEGQRKLVFPRDQEAEPPGNLGSVVVGCGRCIGCREKRAAAWTHRIMHEAQMHPVSSFVTLTYDDAHVRPGLHYPDFQLFMRYLRRELGAVRFFAVGEYGDINQRPHFHAVIFGHHLGDGFQVGDQLFQSRVLSRLWRYGLSSSGSVTRASAAYCARYSLKKVSGPRAEGYYSRLDVRTGEVVDVVPEFVRMSLKPGIGYTWFQKYWRDVYKGRDGVCLPGGYVSSAPRYYDKLLEGLDPWQVMENEVSRMEKGLQFAEESTPARLLVQEQCVKAKLRLKRRSL